MPCHPLDEKSRSTLPRNLRMCSTGSTKSCICCGWMWSTAAIATSCPCRCPGALGPCCPWTAWPSSARSCPCRTEQLACRRTVPSSQPSALLPCGSGLLGHAGTGGRTLGCLVGDGRSLGLAVALLLESLVLVWLLDRGARVLAARHLLALTLVHCRRDLFDLGLDGIDGRVDLGADLGCLGLQLGTQ